MANEHTADPVGGSTYLIHSYEHRAYPLSPSRPLTIGRDAACDIMVNEVFVSRHHAEVRADENGRFTVYPTGSTPTILNDLPIDAPNPLHEGDTFTVGTMKFVFTQKRLPVAMAVAEPVAEPGFRASGVDDRRPTLTFPLQGTTKQNGKSTVWIVMAIVLVVVMLVIYQFI